jgi:hypothetical protein
MEMKNNLKHRLDLNEMASPGEKKVFEYFKQLIINTSLPRLLFSANHDNETILRTWNNVINCSDSLIYHRNIEWSALHTTWTEKKAAHEQCRTKEAESSQENNTECTQCNDHFRSLNPPTQTLPYERTPVFHTTATAEQSPNAEYGADRKYLDLLTYFAAYNGWHCDAHHCPATDGYVTHLECQQACNVACVTETVEHQNLVQNCSNGQDEFEAATCAWNDDITNACQQFADCKKDHDPVYSTTIAQTHESTRRREVEFQIMKTIICFIDLLTADERPTATDKANCQKHYPMDMFTLYYPHTQYQDENATVYVAGSSDCTCVNYPAPASGCPVGELHTDHYSNSIPCTGFVEEYYMPQPWYSVAPPDACNPCS